MQQQTIGLIGAGQMATALAGGFVASRSVPADRIWAGDPSPQARERFAARVPGAHVVSDNHEVAHAADCLVLAVKPQQVDGVLADLKRSVGPGHLVVSICAGVRLAQIESALEPGVRLIRAMPNTPALVRQSATGYALGSGASEEDADRVGRLLASVGSALRVEEKLLDAVTGLAGSGPAFVLVMIEALADAGVLMGLPREAAAALAVQTVSGAAALVKETGEHPAVLKDRVASPAGTTIAGLKALEEQGVRGALLAAVEAATRRSVELGTAADRRC